MITIEDIKKNSKVHPMGEGRIVKIENENLILSIVGGRQGLYGDFDKTFEVALINPKTRGFVREPEFNPNDDVVGYVEDVELIALINRLFKDGFQFGQ